MTDLSVTDRAVAQIEQILSAENAGSMLRISVLGGGCSGFQYDFSIDTQQQDDDVVLGTSTTKVLIDPISVQYMEGSQIDWVDDLIGASFQIRNPNATAACGCGTSFSI